MKPWLIVLCLALWGGSAGAQALTLSPAVVPLGGRPGQSTSQHLTLVNGTSQRLSFALVAKDVVVRSGERVFANAGDVPNSIAATAVFSTPTVTLGPGEQRMVNVRVTLPAHLDIRAVVILFQGTTKVKGGALVSIGSLLTFDLDGKRSVAPGELEVRAPTASANASCSLPITNDGSEPTIVRAAAAIVRADGALVGKLALDSRRLLPGEVSALRAEYPGELPSGTYRVVATIESAKRSWTRTAELVVP